MTDQIFLDSWDAANSLYEKGEWAAARAVLLDLSEAAVVRDDVIIRILRCDQHLGEHRRALTLTNSLRMRGSPISLRVLYEECKVMSRLGDPAGIISAIASADLTEQQLHQFDQLISRARTRGESRPLFPAEPATDAPPAALVAPTLSQPVNLESVADLAALLRSDIVEPMPVAQAVPAGPSPSEGMKFIVWAIGSGQAMDWAAAAEVAKSFPAEVKQLRRLISVLVRNQLYEEAAALVHFLAINHRMSGEVLLAAQYLEAGAQLVSAFELLDGAAPHRDLAVVRQHAELTERLNIWNYQLSGRVDLAHTSLKDASLKAMAQDFLGRIGRAEQVAPFEASRYLLEEIARQLQKERQLVIAAETPQTSVAVISMHSGFGGAPGKAMRLAGELAHQGVSVTMVFDAKREPRDEHRIGLLRAHGVALIECEDATLEADEQQMLEMCSDQMRPLLLLLRIVRPLYKYKSIVRMAARLRQVQPETVHVIGTLDLQICAFFAARLAGVRNVLLNPGMMRSAAYAKTEQQVFEAEFHRFVLSAILKHDPQVVLVNNSLAAARDFEDWLQQPPGSIGVLLNGVEMPEVPPRLLTAPVDNAAAARPLQISVIGRLAQEKRPIFAVEMLAEVLKQVPNACVRFAGDGPLRGLAEARCNALGLNHAMTFLGNVTNIAALLVETDCVLLISDGEGMPNTLIEAQVMGVPVVSSNAGGAGETFIDRETGLLVRSETRREFVDAIVMVLTNPQYRKNAVARMTTVRAGFSMARMASDSQALYRRFGSM